MLAFPFLTDAGARVAAISGRDEGDCAARPEAGENRARWFERLGIARRQVASVRQVHGTRIVEAGGDGDIEADGLITDCPETVLAIAVADCVPVFLFDAVRGAVGLLHAGRAGTQGNIAGCGVRMLEDTYGCRPRDMRAVIGPSICGRCYEVSPSMAEDFHSAGYVSRGRHIDLWATNRMQLEAAGLPGARICCASACTLEDDQFFSFRRDRTAARNLAVLGR